MSIKSHLKIPKLVLIGHLLPELSLLFHCLCLGIKWTSVRKHSIWTKGLWKLKLLLEPCSRSLPVHFAWNASKLPPLTPFAFRELVIILVWKKEENQSQWMKLLRPLGQQGQSSENKFKKNFPIPLATMNA